MILLFFGKDWFSQRANVLFSGSNQEQIGEIDAPKGMDYLPTNDCGKTVHHGTFSLSYCERHEQAEWVAYELTISQLNAPKFKRSGYFDVDPLVKSGSAEFKDYKSSGYTKGHLIPSADRLFSTKANIETFYMSNMSPQKRAFNGGVWRELEENVRDWARKRKKIIVVTGPILSSMVKQIGKRNRISVPGSFYKIILDQEKREAIGFVIPNEVSTSPLADYATSINDIEKATNIDFFPNLWDDQREEKIESEFLVSNWRFDKSRFENRLKHWNKN